MGIIRVKDSARVEYDAQLLADAVKFAKSVGSRAKSDWEASRSFFIAHAGFSADAIGKHLNKALKDNGVKGGTSRAYVGVLKSYRNNIGEIPADLLCADAFAKTKPFAKKKNGKETNVADLSEREKMEARLVEIVAKLNDFELSALVLAAEDMAPKGEAATIVAEPAPAPEASGEAPAEPQPEAIAA